MARAIPDEDFAAAVDVQRNIDAGTVAELRVGANEHLLVDHLEAVRACADHAALATTAPV